MVEIRGFRALRYAPRVVGSLASVVAPPYDVIGAAEQRRLWERSPYNAVRLILPAADLPAEQREQGYRRAAERLQAWKETGALAADPRPAFYLYRQRFTLPGGEIKTRQGFFGLARLTEWGEGIYRHEQTLPGPISDRIRLIESCRANLSSIFGLYSDPQGEVMAVFEAQTAGKPATGEATDDQGVWHGLWRVDDPAAVAQVSALLRERAVVVADGHHRYTANLEYRRRQRAANPAAPSPAPWDYCLFYFGALEDPGLVILPTHQALSGLDGFAPMAFVERMRSTLIVEEFPSLTSLRDALTLSERREMVAVGVLTAGPRYYLCVAPRPACPQAPEEALDVSVLRHRLVEPLLQQHGAAESLEAHLRYTHDAQEALAWVAAGQVDVAFILRPTPLEQVRTVALAHRLMPQKSTYFWPKLLSGLVIYDHTI